ncbi:MAG: stage III sporulation protein AE [Clostridiales bacterium]|nr:stage III sporulation protein AE [Clostridiales bacterium]
MHMKKIICFIILILFTFSISTVYAVEELLTTEKIIHDQIDRLNIFELQEIIDEVNKDLENYIPRIEIKKLILQMIKGEEIVSLNDITKTVLKILFKEIIANWSLLTQIIVLALLSSLLQNLQNAFEREVISKLAYNTCYLIIISITIKSFIIAIDIGSETIDLMVNFMQALLPILLTMLMAMGGLTSSAFLHPILLTSIGFIGTIIKNLVFPLILFSAVLSIVNSLSSKIQVKKLSSLLKQSAIIILGFVLTVFIGIISIQGITASTVDGLGLRTTKFVVDKLIPIVGGFLSDAMSTVIGCSLVLKNTIGAIGVFSLFMLCFMPLIKILSLIIVYKIATVVIEPIGDNALIDCLNNISNLLIVLFGVISSLAIMFFIIVTTVVSAGNITSMMK